MRVDTEHRAGLGAAVVLLAAALASALGATGRSTVPYAAQRVARVTAEQPVLGPAGYKALGLGMGESDAVATGLIVDQQTIGQCHWYYLAPGEGRQNPGDGVVISPSRGVVSIPGTEESHTPEMIVMGSVDNSAGSTLDEVKRAYPNLSHRSGNADFLYQTPVPGNAGAHYGFAIGDDGRVKDMTLTAEDDGGCGLNGSVDR